jgi:hypothetical protein
MAPFGRMIETQLMFANSPSIPDFLVRLYSISNKSHSNLVGGIELQVVRYPVHINDHNSLYLTPTVMFAQQPKDLSFYTAFEWMAMMGLKASYPVSKWAEVFGEVRYKTKGWVPDMLYLNAQTTFRAGAAFKF